MTLINNKHARSSHCSHIGELLLLVTAAMVNPFIRDWTYKETDVFRRVVRSDCEKQADRRTSTALEFL
jgi:hypothetical protein